MPDIDVAHHITYYRCPCGCDQLVLRLHHNDGDIFAAATFEAPQARMFASDVTAMYQKDAIGEVAGHA